MSKLWIASSTILHVCRTPNQLYSHGQGNIFCFFFSLVGWYGKKWECGEEGVDIELTEVVEGIEYGTRAGEVGRLLALGKTIVLYRTYEL